MTNKLQNSLAAAAKIKDSAERAVGIAAVLARALRQVGQDPVLVGGAAVEFYTQGGYSTEDIDMVAPGGADLVKTMEQLGFEKMGKDFIHEPLKVYVEFPGASLGPDERFQEIQMGGQHLRIISVEDLIVDRLASFKFWQSAIDGTNAMLLLELENIDETRLLFRARQENTEDALGSIRALKDEVIRKKLNKEKGSRLLLKKMKALKKT